MRPTKPPASVFLPAAGNHADANPAANPYARPQGPAHAAIDLDVFQTPELAGFESTAEEAIFILSQSATGRRLMQNAMNADYGVIFIEDPDKNLRGYVDWKHKNIFLAKEPDPRLLALTLGHELAHVSQHVNGGVDINVIEDHPLHALKKFIAIEADARAYEIKIALELEYGDEANPGALRFKNLAQMAAVKTDIGVMPQMVARIEQRMQEGSIMPDRIMAVCFRAFYYDVTLRATYENRLMTRIEGLDKNILSSAQSFSRLTDSSGFIAHLDGHDISYMRKNAALTNLDDPELAAICARTADRLQKIAAQRPVNDNNPAAAWTAPIYAPPAEEQKPTPKPAPKPKPPAPQGRAPRTYRKPAP